MFGVKKSSNSSSQWCLDFGYPGPLGKLSEQLFVGHRVWLSGLDDFIAYGPLLNCFTTNMTNHVCFFHIYYCLGYCSCLFNSLSFCYQLHDIIFDKVGKSVELAVIREGGAHLKLDMMVEETGPDEFNR